MLPAERLAKDRLFTYDDYLTWTDGRWELIDGVPYAMSPAPSRMHQRIVTSLAALLESFLQGSPCTPIVAPFDVVFEEGKQTDTVVQPDITVWCKKHENENAKETLTLVVEVLSPATTHYDLNQKRDLYERQSVPEYWVVSPEGRWIGKYVLTDDKYVWTAFEQGEFVTDALSGFSLDVKTLFDQAEK